MSAGTAVEDTGNESLVTVLVAFFANLAIALAKTVAAVITASASMVAEAAHSWADAGNEVFLYIAGKRAAKPADDRHPLGYGRDAYVWSMFAAVGLFTVGAAVSIQHGVSELGQHGPAEDVLLNFIVLAVSFVLEGISFARGFSQVRRAARNAQSDVLSYTVNTSDPTVRAVVFEDVAALAGIVIAAVGVGLHALTGAAVFDACGSIAVGLVLGVVAVILIQQNRKFLIGEAVDPRIRQAVLEMLVEHREIKGVTYLHLEYVGPGSVYLVAAVDLEGDEPEGQVAVRLRQLAQELQRRPHVQRAVLTLSAPGDPPVVP